MIHRLKDPKLKPYACALILFTLNLLIAWRLFWVEFTTHMNSNEGTFMAVSRFLVENGFHFDWFPYWMNGIPFENTYSPLVQIMNALVSVATHWSAARAFHFTLAFFYCLGPCLLFLFAWRITGLLRISFLAALLYSLFSPSTMYGPVRGDVGGWSYPRRLHTMVAYGEAAHNIVLALLPLALLLIWLAVTRKQWHWNLLAGCSMAVLVLMNAFAAVDLGLATACLVAFYGGFKRMLLIGPAAYLSICPFLTPSLIQTIRKDSALSGFHVTSAALRVDALIVSGAILIWFWLRRRSPFDGLVLSLAWIFTVIASFAHWFGIAVLPQSERYHLEMELTICLAFVFAIRSLLRPMGTGILIGVLATQFLVYRTYARELIKKNDITNTVDYRLARWIGTNLPGKRIMAGGEFGFWFNVFADNPQFKGGHNPFSPNWTVENAAYAIYSGEGAGANDGRNALLWLKAFGCHAVVVPGPDSTDAYHDFRNPKKFDGLVPVLHRDGDNTIYGIPQRSDGMASVVPADAVVRNEPNNGLDLDEVIRFVSALDDPALPLATMEWTSRNHAVIHATVAPRQVIAVAVTYDPGWRATNDGTPVRVSRSGIGLMTLHPDCNGPCPVDLSFTGGTERLLCRIASWTTILTFLLISIYKVSATFFAARRSFPPSSAASLEPSSPTSHGRRLES